MVVVDAAPSSRVKAMINSIMGASLLLGTAVSPVGRELEHKKICLRDGVGFVRIWQDSSRQA